MKNKVSNNQKGSVQVLCLILSILIVLAIREYWTYLIALYDIKTALIISLFLSFFVISTTLISLYSVFSGEKSPGQMRRIIKKQKIKLTTILKNTRAKIHSIEKNIKYTSNIMNPKGFQELSTLKGLVSALESRVSRVNELLSTKEEEHLYAAYNTMFDEVTVYGNSLSGLIITEDENTIFSYDDIEKEFNKRLKLILEYLPEDKNKKRARVATA